jgi:hypothetical protein
VIGRLLRVKERGQVLTLVIALKIFSTVFLNSLSSDIRKNEPVILLAYAGIGQSSKNLPYLPVHAICHGLTRYTHSYAETTVELLSDS